MSSPVVEEVKKNPTITAVIDGSIVNVTERTPSGVIAQRTISLREYFEGVGEIYKPYHLEKSPYFQVFGTNWTALRFWQHNTDGTVTCIVEATPRLYDMSAHHIGVFDGAGSNSEGMFNKYVQKEYDELKACGRLSYDTSNSSLVAKLHMPYTIICVKLQPVTSNKGRDVAYKVMKGSIMFSDKPTVNLASEVYSIPLPNTYCFPYRSNVDSPICWGNALDKMEFTIESTPVLIERFYGSNFNGDLVDNSWYGKTLPYLSKGENFDTKEKYPKVLTQPYIKAGAPIVKPIAGDRTVILDTKTITVEKMVKIMSGQGD